MHWNGHNLSVMHSPPPPEVFWKEERDPNIFPRCILTLVEFIWGTTEGQTFTSWYHTVGHTICSECLKMLKIEGYHFLKVFTEFHLLHNSFCQFFQKLKVATPNFVLISVTFFCIAQFVQAYLFKLLLLMLHILFTFLSETLLVAVQTQIVLTDMWQISPSIHY